MWFADPPDSCRAAYAAALLHEGLGIGLDDNTLMFTDKITDPGGEPLLLDWTLGEQPSATVP